MSEIDKTGGPAYPVADVYFPNGQIQLGSTGMTLRDHFAGLALQAIIAGTWTWGDIGYTPKSGFSDMMNNCLCAYEYADAMLEARTKQ